MHPLLQTIRTIAIRARRLVCGRALALWMCAMLLVTFAFGMSDYLFRYRELPLRWFCFCGVLVGAVVSWLRWVRPVFAQQWSDRHVAQLIERRLPELRENLSNAVAFLHMPSNDPRFGSPRLREEVVRRAATTATIDLFSSVLDPRPARRAATGLLAVCFMVGIICLRDRESALLAARRLIIPWSQDSWPRQQHLAFTSAPSILPYGQDFEVELVDEHDRLPDEVNIALWFENDEESSAGIHRMTFAGGKMTYRLPGVTRSFRYRASGGDDMEMTWRSLRVVVPPRVIATRITLRPPAYTGRPVESPVETPADATGVNQVRRIQAIAGTTAEVHVQFDKPIRTGAIRFRSGQVEETYPALIAADGRSGQVPTSGGLPWTLSISGTYGWQLTDRAGMTAMVGDNIEVDIRPDLPPAISLESPGTEAGFTPRAIVPVRVLVKDDLAVHRVEFRNGDLLRVLADFPPPQGISSKKLAPSDDQKVIEYAWDLSEIPDLKGGATLPFELVAADFRPQWSSPAGGQIRILSAAEFQQRLEQDQLALVQRLKETLDVQRTVHQQTHTLVAQLASNQRLTEADAAVWPVLEPAQRRVAALLTAEEGAVALVERLLRDLSINRWDAPQLTAHLNAVRAEVGRIAGETLPPIQQRLGQADRKLRFADPAYASIQQDWSAAASEQERVVAALESLVDRLGEWDRYRNLAQEVRQALEENAAMAAAARELPTAGRDFSQLTADERAPLERLAQRLNDSASQIDRLQSRLDRLRQQLVESNPAAAKTLQDALEVLDRVPISGGIREAARAVAENRLGATEQELKVAQDGLEKLLAALEPPTPGDPQAWESRLEKALAGWTARQEVVIGDTVSLRQQKTDAAVADAAAQELSHTQRTLAEEVAEMAASVPNASSYALALELAARPMDRAGERLAQSQVDEPTLQFEREALGFLQKLSESLATPPQSEQPHADSNEPPDSSQSQPPSSRQPTLAELKLMRLVQGELLRRTEDLERRRGEAGTLSDQQLAELEELTEKQRRLAERLEEVSTATPPPNSQPQEPAAEDMGWKDGGESTGIGASNRMRRMARPVSWLQDENGPRSTPPKPTPPTSDIDRALLDDLPPTPKPNAAGEDVGQPAADSSPVAKLRRQLRQIESLLRQRNVSSTTQELQRGAAQQLTAMIEELEQRESPAEQQSPKTQRPTKPTPDPNSTPAARPSNQPGSGTGGTTEDREGVTNWARGVWGILPDRVRQQIQDLGDEQFLPEYEEIIRRYYDRLSERGRK